MSITDASAHTGESPADPIRRTTVSLPESVWEDLRVMAIRRKLTASEAAEAAIRLWLETPEAT